MGHVRRQASSGTGSSALRVKAWSPKSRTGEAASHRRGHRRESALVRTACLRGTKRRMEWRRALSRSCASSATALARRLLGRRDSIRLSLEFLLLRGNSLTRLLYCSTCHCAAACIARLDNSLPNDGKKNSAT
jgi:hypothetical protein